MGLFDSLFPKKDAEYYKWRGRKNKLNKKNFDALKDFNKAIELNPKDAENYYYRAYVYMALSNKAMIDAIANDNMTDTCRELRESWNEKWNEDMRTAAKLGDLKAKEYLERNK